MVERQTVTLKVIGSNPIIHYNLIYWKKIINENLLDTNYLEKKLIKNNANYNINNKNTEKTKFIELDNKLKFTENLEIIKKKFKLKGEDSIDNWDSYKKKYKFTKKLEIKKINKIIFLSTKNIKKVIENSKYFYKNVNISSIIEKFKKINEKKLNNIITKNNWFLKKPIFAIIDLRSLKTKIIFFNKLGCISTITNGIVFKKLQFNNKKYKKSEKLSFLSVKIIILNIQNFLNNRNLIVQIKGLKKINKTLIKYFNQMVVKNNAIKTFYINNYKIGNNAYFKFKKIKAIKRRLKKKIVKLK